LRRTEFKKFYVVDPQALQNFAATSGNFLVSPHACLAPINAVIAGDAPNNDVVYMKTIVGANKGAAWNESKCVDGSRVTNKLCFELTHHTVLSRLTENTFDVTMTALVAVSRMAIGEALQAYKQHGFSRNRFVEDSAGHMWSAFAFVRFTLIIVVVIIII
jgi:hypothetical protein